MVHLWYVQASPYTCPADRPCMQNKYSAAYKAYQEAQKQANLAQDAFRTLVQQQEREADRFRTAQLGERDKVCRAGYCMHLGSQPKCMGYQYWTPKHD